MGLSVIVTAYGSRATLFRCLASLVPQVAEVVVADCSPDDPTAEIQQRFPSVKVQHFSKPTRVPKMRWTMLPQTSQPLVAAIEGRCVPAPDWAAKMEAGFTTGVAGADDINGVGGAVAAAEGTAFDEAVWVCEYARFAAPLAEGMASDLSGANLCYRRAALLAESDILAGGHWETLLHQRWQGKLRTVNAVVTFHNGLRPIEFARQRFTYGRGYAADRTQSPKRFLYGCFTPFLPFLLTARSGFRPRSFFWVLVFHTFWSAGELVGYWFGSGERDTIY